MREEKQAFRYREKILAEPILNEVKGSGQGLFIINRYLRRLIVLATIDQNKEKT